jgi:polygalacturonase
VRPRKITTCAGGISRARTLVGGTPATARNTDGVDPVSESDVTIRDDMIQNGDDCVAVKSNAGLPSRNITVDDVHCYGSHGLSVGSQTAGGVDNVLFEHSTLNG